MKEEWKIEFDLRFVDKFYDINGKFAYEELKNYPSISEEIKEFISKVFNK